MSSSVSSRIAKIVRDDGQDFFARGDCFVGEKSRFTLFAIRTRELLFSALAIEGLRDVYGDRRGELDVVRRERPRLVAIQHELADQLATLVENRYE